MHEKRPLCAFLRGGEVSDIKACAICLRKRPQQEFRRDRRTRDGLARRCAQCLQERLRRLYRRKRSQANLAHRRWRRNPENRLKKAIWSEMWRNRFKPLPIMRRLQVYGPPWIPDRAGRVRWLIENWQIRSIRSPQEMIAYLGPEGTRAAYCAYGTISPSDYEFGRYAWPIVAPVFDKRTREYRRIQKQAPPFCPIW